MTELLEQFLYSSKIIENANSKTSDLLNLIKGIRLGIAYNSNSTQTQCMMETLNLIQADLLDNNKILNSYLDLTPEINKTIEEIAKTEDEEIVSIEEDSKEILNEQVDQEVYND